MRKWMVLSCAGALIVGCTLTSPEITKAREDLAAATMTADELGARLRDGNESVREQYEAARVAAEEARKRLDDAKAAEATRKTRKGIKVADGALATAATILSFLGLPAIGGGLTLGRKVLANVGGKK